MSRLDAFLNPEDILARDLAAARREATRVRTHIKAVIDTVLESTTPGDESIPAVFSSGMLTGLSVAVMILDGKSAEQAMEKVAEKTTELAGQVTADSTPAEVEPKCPRTGCELTYPHLHSRAEMSGDWLAAIKRVRQLHRPVEYRGMTICGACSDYDASTDSTDSSPVAYHLCATLAALNEPEVS